MNDFFRLDLDAATAVATLELHRPERLNTLAPPFFPALRDAVQRLSDEGRTRALVLRSTGRHFSAGMALEVFAGVLTCCACPQRVTAWPFRMGCAA